MEAEKVMVLATGDPVLNDGVSIAITLTLAAFSIIYIMALMMLILYRREV